MFKNDIQTMKILLCFLVLIIIYIIINVITRIYKNYFYQNTNNEDVIYSDIEMFIPVKQHEDQKFNEYSPELNKNTLYNRIIGKCDTTNYTLLKYENVNEKSKIYIKKQNYTKSLSENNITELQRIRIRINRKKCKFVTFEI